ncbi:hypothetical protein XM38_015770 [Halomicronema hongdechloris C2206]|uniref:Uncharacterized protein n=1 Tax=Halomicronema hongdechloris C2206 TaxID=1641165 RepID=A0A1Z3HKL7_9CYAN|nr:hypothetical protein XM38_015770 [Halomicronema hongdechloris C2206]
MRLGRRYGLAPDAFPQRGNRLGGGSYALQLYHRESRRLIGLTTLREQAILPQLQGQVAPLPVDAAGQVTAIAVGNYAPTITTILRHPGRCSLRACAGEVVGRERPLPFPMVPWCRPAVDGLLVCEKNISVSHIANGATRLQPVVLGIGQAAGMAAALCVEQGCQPRDLSVRSLQEALIGDPWAPAAVIPLLDGPKPGSDAWRQGQRRYLEEPEQYPRSGESAIAWGEPYRATVTESGGMTVMVGRLRRQQVQSYALTNITVGTEHALDLAEIPLVTLRADINHRLAQLREGDLIRVWGHLNRAGPWLRLQGLAVAAYQKSVTE